MSVSPTLRVCALYPSRLNIYADRGNMMILQRRCEARGIGFELTASEISDRIDPGAHDLFYIGGGQDSDQRQIAADLVEKKRVALVSAVDAGKVLLAICGGYQLLGHYYEIGGERVDGLGIADLTTVREDGPRLIGNALVETEITGEPRLLAGFENHGGRTRLAADTKPLGRVVAGHGNDGRDRTEGVWQQNVVGTYLHGPLLPKNAWFADHLTSLALGGVELEPLDDALEESAHRCAIEAAKR